MVHKNSYRADFSHWNFKRVILLVGIAQATPGHSMGGGGGV